MASLQVAKPDDAMILTDVYKGGKVVLDAIVVADVYGPNPPYKTTVPLHDDGSDPDIRKNEGTYSGYFVQFTGKGRYVVTVHVSGDEKTRLGDPWRHYYPTNVIVGGWANVIVESPGKRRSCSH
ncbi:calcium-activated chloride channel regulator 2-like [Rhipicephalus microplus]|uniref:calcium-activated chloride channel regulator 2-like n=1 Tax=Rhipicephalus microplus TaxID=6941 RepID=UPI003F6C94AF